MFKFAVLFGYLDSNLQQYLCTNTQSHVIRYSYDFSIRLFSKIKRSKSTNVLYFIWENKRCRFVAKKGKSSLNQQRNKLRSDFILLPMQKNLILYYLKFSLDSRKNRKSDNLTIYLYFNDKSKTLSNILS